MSAARGVRFTEEMKGFAAFGEQDFARGFEAGRRDGTSLMFHLTIEVDPVARFAADPRRRGTATGWVGCHALGGRLAVERGIFNLLVDTPEPGVKNMLYRLHFADGVGHPLTLSGHKLIRRGTAFDVWPDTSTLYTRVLRGHVGPEQEGDAEPVAAGILHILKRDFARQLTTFRSPDRAEIPRFAALFTRDLWPLYGRLGRPRGAQTGLTGSSRRA